MLLRFSLRGAGVEKPMNEALRRGVRLRFVRRHADRTLGGFCLRRDAAALESICQEAGFALEWRGGDAVYRAVKRLRYRYGLLVGAVIFPFLVSLLMSFVWEVRVLNAAQYIGEVRLFLEENDVRPGRRLSEISPGTLQSALEHRLPAVKWARVALRGVTLFVDLTPGTTMDRQAPSGGDVVAAQDGLLTRVTCFAGTPLVKAGEAVKKGQVLFAGYERGSGEEQRAVRAQGVALARVWTQATASVSLVETISIETGRVSQRLLIETPFFTYAKEEPPNYLTGDVTRVKTPLGAFLPVYAVRETYRELMLEFVPRDEADCRREAAEIADFLLIKALPADDEVVDKWVDYSMIDRGSVTATVTAETLKNIASPNVP